MAKGCDWRHFADAGGAAVGRRTRRASSLPSGPKVASKNAASVSRRRRAGARCCGRRGFSEFGGGRGVAGGLETRLGVRVDLEAGPGSASQARRSSVNVSSGTGSIGRRGRRRSGRGGGRSRRAPAAQVGVLAACTPSGDGGFALGGERRIGLVRRRTARTSCRAGARRCRRGQAAIRRPLRVMVSELRVMYDRLRRPAVRAGTRRSVLGPFGAAVLAGLAVADRDAAGRRSCCSRRCW